ncbi:hypothetical protein [Phaeodactylibacter xiamenensis]|uniref:hypothetical protein n=1 Tax=Phaeodactylibacter xiamenensis TaxID=1524460 RepID=UPI003BADB1AE
MTKNISTRASVFIFLALCITAKAQSRLSVGIEAGSTCPIYHATDFNNTLSLEKTSQFSFFGIVVSRAFNQFHSLETGILINSFHGDYEITDSSLVSFTTTNGPTVYQIPLRLNTNFPIFKQFFKSKLFLKSVLGYHFGINTSYEEPDLYQSGFSITRQGTTLTYDEEAKSNYGFRRTFNLFELGLGLELFFGDKVSLFGHYNYLFGTDQLFEIDIAYQINGGDIKREQVNSNGSYRLFKFGVKYHL